MPTIKKILVTGNIYHIYNRGNEKRIIFPDDTYFKRFIKTIDYYRFIQPIKLSTHIIDEEKDPEHKLNQELSELVQVLAFCLMPNHFHLVLRQKIDGGITKFMNDVSNSYAKYFNLKNNRVGPLFQGSFKAKSIDSGESFMQVTRYIHLNPSEFHPSGGIHGYPYSSYDLYIGKTEKIGPSLAVNIKDLINSPKEYREFVESKIGLKPGVGIGDLILE